MFTKPVRATRPALVPVAVAVEARKRVALKRYLRRHGIQTHPDTPTDVLRLLTKEYQKIRGRRHA